MDFNSYLNQAWDAHGHETLKVAGEIKAGAELAKTPGDLAKLAALVTHVLGQHLGRFEEAIRFLTSLRTHSHFVSAEAEGPIARSIAALRLASNQLENLDQLSASDQSRVYAQAAAILCERDAVQAREYLFTAMSIAAAEIEKTDPAIAALAAATHNLAAALEVKKTLSSEEEQLMLEAALASKKYWELAGSWPEWKQAEYRLAMSCAKAKKFEDALHHAKEGIRICEENKGSALEYFFGYECLALVERARGHSEGFADAAAKARGHYSQLNVEDKKYCEESLRALG